LKPICHGRRRKNHSFELFCQGTHAVTGLPATISGKPEPSGENIPMKTASAVVISALRTFAISAACVSLNIEVLQPAVHHHHCNFHTPKN
jgi:hypothetical protein